MPSCDSTDPAPDQRIEVLDALDRVSEPDGERAAAIRIVAGFLRDDPLRSHTQMTAEQLDLDAGIMARQIVDALGPMVPLARAQELERERDEARAELERFYTYRRTPPR